VERRCTNCYHYAQGPGPRFDPCSNCTWASERSGKDVSWKGTKWAPYPIPYEEVK
jgi:hypothetical protein